MDARQKKINNVIGRHPLHSKTEYLTFDRVHNSTQTSVSELPNLKNLTEKILTLQADFDRTKLSLKAQYELQINDKVNSIWQQLHTQISASDARNQKTLDAMRQAYVGRYVNAIARLSAEFHRQRDALLAHAKELQRRERDAVQQELGKIQEERVQHENQVQKYRIVIAKQAMLLLKYGAHPDENKSLIAEAEQTIGNLQQTVAKRDAEVKELLQRIADYEEVLNSTTVSRRGAAATAVAQNRHHTASGSVRARTAPLSRGSIAEEGSLDELDSVQTSIQEIDNAAPLPATRRALTAAESPRLATPKAFEMGSEAPVVNPQEWVQKEALSSPIHTEDAPRLTPRTISRSAAGTAMSMEEDHQVDEEMLKKAMDELDQSYQIKMEEMAEEHEEEVVRLKMELARNTRNYHKQLAVTKESANVVASGDAMKTVIERQENVLKFAKIFFGKELHGAVTGTRKGVKDTGMHPDDAAVVATGDAHNKH